MKSHRIISILLWRFETVDNLWEDLRLWDKKRGCTCSSNWIRKNFKINFKWWWRHSGNGPLKTFFLPSRLICSKYEMLIKINLFLARLQSSAMLVVCHLNKILAAHFCPLFSAVFEYFFLNLYFSSKLITVILYIILISKL